MKNKRSDNYYILNENIEDCYGNLDRKKKKEQEYYAKVTAKPKTKGRCKNIRPDLE